MRFTGGVYMKIDIEIGTEAKLKDSKLLKLYKISNLLAKVHQRDISCASGGQMYDKLKMFKSILIGQ